MKYSEMAKRISAGKYAKARGREESKQAEPLALKQESASPKYDPPQKANFVMFKSTSSANRCEYVGSLVTPDGRCYAIEANVAEHTRPDGSKGKHFVGQTFGGQEIVRSMLRGAKFDGPPPDDLMKVLEDKPFDDPLPPFDGEAK